MLFPTLSFAVFFLGVFFVFWWLYERHSLAKFFLTIASYGFYAFWSWRFAILLFLSTIINHKLACLIDKHEDKTRKLLTILAVAFNLSILGYFKYSGFFVASFDNLFHIFGVDDILPLNWVSMVLPVGISFFTFHAISYIVDVQKRIIKPVKNIIDILLYISFFPHLIAGPIVRASYFLPQLEHPVKYRCVAAPAAFLLIVFGLFKKIIVADLIGGTLVDPAFMDPFHQTRLALWLGMYGYAVQIYCDFSAYTDIATGVAALFGYQFPRNFDRPYGSLNIREFWTKWHISLSSWLRDYLYIPLGGSRGSKLFTARNLLITMSLGGLWHGANWTFVAWGILHGIALIAAHLPTPRLPKFIAWCLTFHTVCLGWIFFRAPDFDLAWQYLYGLFVKNTEVQPFAIPVAAVVLMIIFLLAQFTPAKTFRQCALAISVLPDWFVAAAAGISVVLIAALGPDGVPPFIYFAF